MSVWSTIEQWADFPVPYQTITIKPDRKEKVKHVFYTASGLGCLWRTSLCQHSLSRKDSFSKLFGRDHAWFYDLCFLFKWDINKGSTSHYLHGPWIEGTYINTVQNSQKVSHLFLQYAFSTITSKYEMPTVFSQGGNSIICHNECLVPGPLWLNSYKASKPKWACLLLCTSSGPSFQQDTSWSKRSKLLLTRGDQM